MSVLENLKPNRVFYYFEEICKIPHGSGDTKQISDHLAEFARAHELSFIQDESNNVIIFKDAAPGYENAPTVILQGHMDMVCEKRPGSSHDFRKDPLTLFVEGDYIHADGTTLGGDDGIALAYALAVLEDKNLPHPALEAVFTVDEEIGLLGASALDTTPLKGKYLINLDSESEGCLCAGCAGGMTCISEIPVEFQEKSGLCCHIQVTGLLGGHSGTEINKIRANATLVLARFLHECGDQLEFSIVSLSGGLKDNAIPRQAEAEILIGPSQEETLKRFSENFTSVMQKEYSGTDENITVSAECTGENSLQVMTPVSQEKIIFFLNHFPNGVRKMCGFIDGLVETSCNLGIVKLNGACLSCSASVRSSVGSSKKALADKIQYLTEFLGGNYTAEGEYPSWEYLQDSSLRALMLEVYREMYQSEPQVEVIHAGLECGLFFANMPGLDCISIGPDMKDIHTSEEKLSISSAARVYEYLLKVLKRIQ